jgi:DHA1 family bicyclomycin/chloramphenicol resistance-like MFS transporter
MTKSRFWVDFLRLLVLMALALLSGAEMDLIVPSFPELQTYYGTSVFGVEWLLSINVIGHCVGALLAGMLGDRLGTRQTMLLGLLVFVLGSVLCAVSRDYQWVLAGRFLQGLGIAAPSVLTYVILSDLYPPERQIAMMGIMNGSVTLAIAGAPLLGSYVNILWGTLANFWLLLGFGVAMLVLSVWVLPRSWARRSSDDEGHRISYLTVWLRPTTFWMIISFCAMVLPYWVFVGLSSVMYVGDFGVSLSSYGWYQGSLCFVFAILNLTSSWVIARVGIRRCFYGGFLVLCLFMIGLLGAIVFDVRSAFWITVMMQTLSIGVIYPVLVLYPSCLESFPEAKGRVAGLLTAIRLLAMAGILQVVSAYHDGSFRPLGIAMVAMMLVMAFGLWQFRRHGGRFVGLDAVSSGGAPGS